MFVLKSDRYVVNFLGILPRLLISTEMKLCVLLSIAVLA